MMGGDGSATRQLEVAIRESIEYDDVGWLKLTKRANPMDRISYLLQQARRKSRGFPIAESALVLSLPNHLWLADCLSAEDLPSVPGSSVLASLLSVAVGDCSTP